MNEATRKTAEALAPAIAAAANRAAQQSPGLDLGDAAQITADVTKEVSAIVVNQTNQEPWFQSTVTWTALGSLVVASYALAYDFLDGTVPTPTEFAPQALAVILPLGTLYGRWVQRKPLGA